MSGTFKEVVQVMNAYLGPASERYVRRQVELHFDKDAEDLTPKDVKRLADSIKVSLHALTKDEDIANEASQKVATM